MKILVTGADGMLGSDWAALLRAEGYQVWAANRLTMDVTDLSAVKEFIEQCRPNLVIHTAAHTDCDEGERRPDLSYSTNTIGAWNVTLACSAVGAQLAYISSCGVFDGNKSSPYTELDSPGPLNHHHRSKVYGERIVSTQHREHFIFRPGWLFGGSAVHSKNFVAKRYHEAFGCSQIQSAEDRFGSPTYTMDFASAAMQVIKDQAFGLYHIVNQGACSRYEYVRGCVAACGLETNVVPVRSDQFPRVATLPDSEVLENYFFALRGYLAPRPWQEALREYAQKRLLPELKELSKTRERKGYAELAGFPH